MTGREPAWRVLAQEFLASTVEEKPEGDRVASYLVSPLGARMNRVLMVGTLSASESIGRQESQPFFRARLSDPTGTVTVTAGGFQPRALAALRAWNAPDRAIVVGKTHLFRGRDGSGYASVRAEALRALTAEELTLGLVEAVEQTVARLRGMQAVRANPAIPDLPESETSVPVGWKIGARLALQKYPTAEPASFEPALERIDLAQPINPHFSLPSAGPARSVGSAHVTRPPALTPAAPPTAAERARESAFLDILDELSESALDGYASLEEALRLAATRGLAEPEAERLLNRLEESGAIEEPIVGKLRRA